MEPNLTRHYLGIATNSARRSQQAERGWLIEQAAAAQKRPRATVVRRWISGMLIVTGKRMQGVRQPEAVTGDLATAH